MKKAYVIIMKIDKNEEQDWDDDLYWDVVFRDQRPTKEQVKQFFIEPKNELESFDDFLVYVTEASENFVLKEKIEMVNRFKQWADGVELTYNKFMKSEVLELLEKKQNENS